MENYDFEATHESIKKGLLDIMTESDKSNAEQFFIRLHEEIMKEVFSGRDLRERKKEG